MEECTKLKDRVLWFDGDSTVEPDTIADMVLLGMNLKRGIYVAEETDDIKQFNSISDIPLTVKTENRKLDFDWDIPEKYITLKLMPFLLGKLEKEIKSNKTFTDNDIEARITRVEDELEKYYKCNLNFLLRAAIYIVDIFREKNVVWGVGRGSACGSYILYLIGIHDIDSVYFDLDAGDFLR
jgi:DNA polymerase III alpha subunit